MGFRKEREDSGWPKRLRRWQALFNYRRKWVKTPAWVPLWSPLMAMRLSVQWPRGHRQAEPACRGGRGAELSSCWVSIPRTTLPGWFYSCLKTLLWLPKLYILQQTQHLGSEEGPYNALYNSNKHDCYKKIRLQNITQRQAPVDCNFKFWLSKEPERF